MNFISCMGVGTLEEIHSFPRIVEWTIPDFYRLPQNISYYISSPSFKYWQFRCKLLALPNGTESLPDILVFRIVGIGKPGITQWELEIRRKDDTVLRKCGGWKKDGQEIGMDMYIPRKEFDNVCPLTGCLKVKCTLYCEVTFSHLEYERCKGTSSQTESTSRTDKLSCDLEEMLTRGDDSDVTIRVKGREFKAHKNILGARTPVFTSMFKYKMSESLTGIVEIDDCDPNAFCDFLHYIYTGRVSQFSPDSIFKLHKVADKYQANELKDYCLEYIKNNLSVDTFCDIIVLCLQHNEEELMDVAVKFLSDNMATIKNTEKWRIFSSENPSESNKLLLEAENAIIAVKAEEPVLKTPERKSLVSKMFSRFLHYK